MFSVYGKGISDEDGEEHRYLQHDLTERAYTPRHKALMMVRGALPLPSSSGRTPQ